MQDPRYVSTTCYSRIFQWDSGNLKKKFQIHSVPHKISKHLQSFWLRCINLSSKTFHRKIRFDLSIYNCIHKLRRTWCRGFHEVIVIRRIGWFDPVTALQNKPSSTPKTFAFLWFWKKENMPVRTNGNNVLTIFAEQ